MPTTNPLSPALLVKAGLEVAKGTSRRKIQALLPAMPERLIRELSRSNMGQSEYRDLLQHEFQDAARETVAAYRSAVRAGTAPISGMPLAAAILVDKAAVLAGRTTMENMNVAAMMAAPKNREELIRSLRGEPDPRPVLAPPSGTA